MLRKLNKKRNQKGFTLVELVVVIAIIGILGAISVPRLSGFKDKAAFAADKATAATIAKAAELYAAANNLKETGVDEEITKATLTISDLQEEGVDMLEPELTPQQEGKAFELEYDSDKKIFYVTYDDDTVLYPEDFIPSP